MSRGSHDDRIDRLYQLPPAEFTRERNALAKEVGGADGKHIRALPKPSAPAWAVNQLYWHDRAAWDALVEASEQLRSAHRAVLAGRKADLRSADAAHREALKASLTSTIHLAKAAGQNISSTVQGEIARTLESLPADDETPGRLSKPLRPGGFEALQGMPIRARAEKPEEPTPAATREPPREPARDKAAEARRRKQVERDLRAARQRQHQARAAVSRLQKELATAERRSATAKGAWERAQAAESSIRVQLREAEGTLEDATRAVNETPRA